MVADEQVQAKVLQIIKEQGRPSPKSGVQSANVATVAKALGLGAGETRDLLKRMPALEHTSHGYWAAKNDVAPKRRRRRGPRVSHAVDRMPTSHPRHLQFVLQRGSTMLYKDGRGGLWLVQPARLDIGLE
jgi:hypothetical protein